MELTRIDGYRLLIYRDHPDFKIIKDNWLKWSSLHRYNGYAVDVTELLDCLIFQVIHPMQGSVNYSQLLEDIMDYVRAYNDGHDLKVKFLEFKNFKLQLSRRKDYEGDDDHYKIDLSIFKYPMGFIIDGICYADLKSIIKFFDEYAKEVQSELLQHENGLDRSGLTA
jgi:hypothetical protein